MVSNPKNKLSLERRGYVRRKEKEERRGKKRAERETKRKEPTSTAFGTNRTLLCE
jgi:hypothetical protein